MNGLEPRFLPAFLKPLFFSPVFGAVNSRQDVRSIEQMSVIFMLFTLSLQLICNLCIKKRGRWGLIPFCLKFILCWCTSTDLWGVTLICTGTPRRRISLMLCEYILKCYSLSVLFKAPGNCLNIKFFMCHCLSRTYWKAKFLTCVFCWLLFSFLTI